MAALAAVADAFEGEVAGVAAAVDDTSVVGAVIEVVLVDLCAWLAADVGAMCFEHMVALGFCDFSLHQNEDRWK